MSFNSYNTLLRPSILTRLKARQYMSFELAVFPIMGLIKVYFILT